jgi:hypothetical protein
MLFVRTGGRMSHSSEFRVRDRGQFQVTHNGDWSGDINIQRVSPQGKPFKGDTQIITIPMELIEQMVAEKLRVKITDWVESAHWTELLERGGLRA